MDGEPLISHGVDDASRTDIDGIPSEKVIDLPMATYLTSSTAVDITDAVELSSTAKVAVTIKSKWELVDYGDDSDK